MTNLPWAIGVLFVLWILWFSTGGPDAGRTERPFLKPLPPVDTGEIYGPENLVPLPSRTPRQGAQQETTPPQEEPREEVRDVSLFGGKVSFTFRGRSSAQKTDPKQEYLEVSASKNNTAPVNITGWTVRSAVTGRSATIGSGSYLPYSGHVNFEERIFLRPGERAYIATGHSPIGVSFRLNTCTGYFEQFQDFSPSLPKECPRPLDEDVPTGPNGLNDECLDFVGKISRCEAYIRALPLSLADNPVCQEHITRKINYNTCVENHKNEASFYKLEWRIYLRRDQELWKEKRETITLLDESGKLVDSISY